MAHYNGKEKSKKTASEVFLLLKKDYRISRNIRLAWFLNNLTNETDLSTLPHVNTKTVNSSYCSPHEIEILSRINDDQQSSERSHAFKLDPNTEVNFVSRGYRLIFVLDFSPSLFRVNTKHKKTEAECQIEALAQCFVSLLQPVTIPGSEIKVHPTMYITVMVKTKPTSSNVNSRYEVKVLVQGCQLTHAIAVTVLDVLEQEIFANKNTTDVAHVSSTVNSDQGLVTLLRNAILSLQVLPSNTSAGIILFTDAVFGVPDMSVLESILTQLRNSTIICSFVKVANQQLPFVDFGYCPNTELIELIAKTTNGSVISYDDMDSTEDGINKFQRACLLYSFRMAKPSNSSLDGESQTLDIRKWDPSTDLRYTPSQKNIYVAPILRKKHAEMVLEAPLLAILSVRLREGYMIQDINIGKRIVIRLVLPWNFNTTIEYTASCDFSDQQGPTKIEISVESTYEFLYDVTVAVPSEKWCKFRSISVKRFAYFIKSLTKSDQILVHLHSFASDSANYMNAPRNVPLFYRHPNSGKLSLAHSHTSPVEQMLAVYWKTIVAMDVTVWQRWMHTHKIEIVLQHDLPLPKHVHTLSGSGKYSAIQSREAMTIVSNFMHEWATFDLLESNCYVKFVYDKSESSAPTSFYLLRMKIKAQIVVIRLGFLIGATGSFRNEVLREIRSKVLALTIRNNQESTNNGGRRSRHVSARSSRHASGNERPCVKSFYKPIDQVLVRYDHSPSNFVRPIIIPSRQAHSLRGHMHHGGYVDTGLQRNVQMQDIVRYFKHRRWVYSVSNGKQTTTSLASAGQIASKLVEMRLQEGFTFASSSSGITNMIREFTVSFNPRDDFADGQNYYLLAQYIIFPPTHAKSDNGSDGSVNGDDCDNHEDKELQLVAEMWVEPQAGFVKPVDLSHHRTHSSLSRLPSDGSRSRYSSSSSLITSATQTNIAALQAFVGCSYKQIPDIVYGKDNGLVSLLVTIEHLRLLSLPDSTLLVPTLPQDCNANKESSPLDQFGNNNKEDTKSTISYFPCLFDLPNLLSKCQRIKMLFTTLSVDVTSNKDDTIHSNDQLFCVFCESLTNLCDRKVTLSLSDNRKLTQHMRERLYQFNKDGEDTPPVPVDDSSVISWNVFVKILSEGKLLVVQFPASYADMKKLLDEMPDYGQCHLADEVMHEDVIDNEQKNKTEGTNDTPQGTNDTPQGTNDTPQGTKSKLIKKSSFSFTNENEANGKWVSRTLPVFVYICCTNSVTEKYYRLSTEATLPPDYEQDYRIGDRGHTQTFSPIRRQHIEHKSVDLNQGELQRSRSFGQANTRYFRSFSQPSVSIQTPTNGGIFFGASINENSVLSPTSTTAFEPDVMHFCDLVGEQYQRSFVKGVFHTLQLHNGSGICDSDLQAATDICDESVKEINITQYLLYTSPQIANFKAKFVANRRISQDADEVFAEENHELKRPTAWVQPIVRRGSSTSSTDPSSTSLPLKIYQQLKSASTSNDPSEQDPSTAEKVTMPLKTAFSSEDNLLANATQSSSPPKDLTLHIKDRSKSAFKKFRKRAKTPPSADSMDADVNKLDEATNNDNANKIAEITSSLKRAVSQRNKNVIEGRVAWEDLPEFPLSLLSEHHARHLSGSNDQVEIHFNDILSQNFIALGNGMFFFRKHTAFEQDNKTCCRQQEDDEIVDATDTTENASETPCIVSESDHDIKFVETTENETTDDGEKKHPSYRSFKKSKKAPKHNDLYDLEELKTRSDDEFSSDEFSSDGQGECQEDNPLFLSLTCSVRAKKTKFHKLIPISTLPKSLLTLNDCFESEKIDLASLHVTLDLIWIFLHDESLPMHTIPDCNGNDADVLLSPTRQTPAPNYGNHYRHQRLPTLDLSSSDLLKQLTPLCKDAVNYSGEEIEWLLKDEIISAFRTCEPITQATLNQVAEHIEGANGRENCQKQTVPLQFVYGAATSHEHFTEEFSKQNFKGHRLKKVGDCFYLTVERQRQSFLPITNEWSSNKASLENFLMETVQHSKSEMESDLSVKFDIGAGPTKPTHPELRQSTHPELRQSTHPELRRTKTAPNKHAVKASQSATNVSWMDFSAEKADDSVDKLPKSTTVSSQSTPIRKTASARELDHIAQHFEVTRHRKSKSDLRRKSMTSCNSLSRLSLPSTTVADLPSNEMLFNTNLKLRSSSTQHTEGHKFSHPTVMMRNSPQIISNPTSPSNRHYSANSSISSAGSAPTIGAVPQPSQAPATTVHAQQQPEPLMGFNSPLNAQLEKVNSCNPTPKDQQPIFSPLSDTEMRRYSQASFMESDGNGYDGEESDLDGVEDEYMMSLQEEVSEMPPFWMIFFIRETKVDIYFHRRSSSELNEKITNEQDRIIKECVEVVSDTCKFVNQHLLLKELHDTRMCHSLLVEEPDEEIWRTTNFRHGMQFEQSMADQSADGCLEASLRFPAGYFACDLVLERSLPIHPRLKTNLSVHSSVSSNITAKLADTLRNFSINNRKNMFVYVLSDQSVFYCRMEEDNGKDSRRSSLLLHGPDHTPEADRRSSHDSIQGLHMAPSEVKPTNVLRLQWHGVHPPTITQKDELEGINKSILKKLDESALESLTVMLQRNFKLTPADVTFIQPRINLSPCQPDSTLTFSVPSSFFLMFLPAIKYYLNQNLLQFLTSPRYTEASGQFLTYHPSADGKTVEADKTFLFYQPPERGKTGYGIACIVVDWNEVKPTSSVEMPTPTSFDPQKLFKISSQTHCGETATEDASKESSDKCAVVNFHLWLKGTLTVKHVKDRLNSALQHALLDSVTEFHILHNPLCDAEKDKVTEEPTKTKSKFRSSFRRKMSFPASRRYGMFFSSSATARLGPLADNSMDLFPGPEKHNPCAVAKETNPHSTITRSHSTPQESEKSDAMRSLISSLHDPSSKAKSFFGFRNDNAGLKDKGSDDSKSPTTSAKDRRSYNQRLEEGDAGLLNKTFRGGFEDWCDKLLEAKNTSVHKFNVDVSYRRCFVAAITDICNILSSIMPLAKVKLFHGAAGQEAIDPCNSPSEDCAKQQSPVNPGRYPSFCIVARNLQLWKKALGQTPKLQQGSSFDNSMKFLPFDPNNRPDQSPRPQEHRMLTPNANALYLPRQQMVTVRFVDCSIVIRSYNLSNEIRRSLQSSMYKAVDFQNGRSHVMQCIWTQKLHLLHHYSFDDSLQGPTEAPEREEKDLRKLASPLIFLRQMSDSADHHHATKRTPNPFTRDVKEVDLLLHHQTLPSEKEIQSVQSVKAIRRAFFHDAFIENRPRRPMHLSYYHEKTDVFKRNAHQYFELKGHLKKRLEEQQQMTRLFGMWKDRTSSNQPVSKETLKSLSKCSRLVHFVSTPLLFVQSWRNNLIKTTQQTKQEEKVDDSSRNRTKSNSSRKGSLKEPETSKSVASKAALKSSKSRSFDHGGESTSIANASNLDLDGLKKTLLQSYTQYWQNAHFTLVQLKNTNSTKTPRSNSKNSLEKSRKSSTKIIKDDENMRYLKRVTKGGIVLVELSCSETFFQIKILILHAARLRNIHQVNKQMTVMFMDDIERYKNYSHLHSFVYDFHIRSVQWYLESRHSAITAGYHVVDFLKEFMLFFHRHPSFARNHIFGGTLDLPCTHVRPRDLYKFLVDKHKLYLNLLPLKMIRNEVDEFALVSRKPVNGLFHDSSCNEDEHELFDVGVIVYLDPDADEGRMKLKYYLLFTSRRFVFPAESFGENLSQFQGFSPLYSPSRKTQIGKFERFKPPPKSSSMHSLQEVSNGTPSPRPVNHKRQGSQLQASDVGIMGDLIVNSKAILESDNGTQTLPAGGRVSVVRQLSGGRRQSVPLINDGTNKSEQQFISSSGEEIQNVSNIVKKQHIHSGIDHVITCEVNRTRDYLRSACANAKKHCYKEHLWSKMIPSDNSDLSFEKFEELLTFLHRVKISELDKSTVALSQPSTNIINLQEQLRRSKRFACRLFTNTTDDLRHLVVLNLKHDKMVVLISVDKLNNKNAIEVVMKDEIDLKQPQPHSSPEASNAAFYLWHLEEVLTYAALQTFKNSFVNYNDG